MNQFDKQLAEIIRGYQRIPEFRAAALIGSRARGNAKASSDIDLMLVCLAVPDVSARIRIIRDMADMGSELTCISDPIDTDAFSRGGARFRIWHVSQDTICDRISSIEKRRRLESTMLVASLFESKILWDPRKQLEAWKSRINPIPKEYQKIVIPQIFAETTSVIEDISDMKEDQNLFYFHHEISGALENLHEIIFLLNGQFLNLSHRLDEIIGAMKFTPEGFLIGVQQLLKTSSDTKNMKMKWKMLAELTRLIGKFIEKNGNYNLGVGWAQLHSAAPFLFESQVSYPDPLH